MHFRRVISRILAVVLSVQIALTPAFAAVDQGERPTEFLGGMQEGCSCFPVYSQYTDTPMTIIAEDRLSIYTGRTTYLLGAGLASEIGNLTLDTGGLVFDNFNDSDVSKSFGVSGSIDFSKLSNSDVGGSFGYSNTQALTFATVGAGEIRVRDYEGYDFSALNRDIDNMQRVTSHKEFRIEIPGINLARWTQQVQDTVNLIEAVTTTIPQAIKNEGKQAVDQYRDLIFQGLTPQDAAVAVSTPRYRKMLEGREAYLKAMAEGKLTSKQQALALALIAQGEQLHYDDVSGELLAIVGCGTASSGYSAIPCGAASFNELAFLSDDDVESFITTALAVALGEDDTFLGALPPAAREAVRREQLHLALECAIAWAAQGGDGGPDTSNAAEMVDLVMGHLPAGEEYAVWQARLEAALDVSSTPSVGSWVAIAHNHENPVSFDMVEIVRLNNSADPADRALAWEMAQSLHLTHALANTGDAVRSVTDGLLTGFLVQEFSDRSDVEAVLNANFDAAEADFIANIESLKEELGVAGATVTALILARGFAGNRGYRLFRGFRGTNRTPNLTERGTLTNLNPGDEVRLLTQRRTLIQDDNGRYWLQSANGQRVTPSGRYDFVTMPDGTVQVARPNSTRGSEHSTHLGLSGGGEVNYAGSITFTNNSRANRGSIASWSNNSGHYKPPSNLSGNSGLPQNFFNPTNFD